MGEQPATYRGKRAFDLAILAFSLPLTLPIGLATALAIKFTDGTPIIFQQERAGLRGRPIFVCKFRTMSNSRGPNGELLPDRDRLTPIGRVLRRTSLDEIPQLINVLRGDMSIVGPRPLYLRYVPNYTEREKKRLDALPGITGLAQVSGRNAAGWRNRLELDAQYLENNSLLGDIKICLQTAVKSLRSEGVSIIAGDSGDPLDIERSFPSENGLYLRRLYQRDLPLRVRWMSHNKTRRYMNLPEEISLESTSDWYTKIKSEPYRHEFAVEDETGQVVAMTGLRSHRPFSSAEFYVFVDPASHGKGIGRIATKLTIQEARAIQTIPSITLTVDRENQKAVSIYRDMGFVESQANERRLWMTLPLEADNARR